MIVGTAGHIDHGKTSLVKALTGIDCDRLKEEKARGITIELGFAYWPRPSGAIIGFVDVPGHERLVHTMLAGATGIDFVVLVIAADDGVMPQTREHLAILDLLGLDQGVVAMTKCDLADAPGRAAVEAEIRAVLAGSKLAAANIIPVSATTGEGLDQLTRELDAASARAFDRRTDGAFRLAIDRVFSLAGAGTIVTGTVLSGKVAIGDKVVISPRNIDARVRTIHAQNRSVQVGQAGQRCALALAGPDVSTRSIARGNVVLAPQIDAPTTRIDVDLKVLSTEKKPVVQWMPVRLHFGAADVAARVVVLSGETLAPGASGYAQLVTEEPVAVAVGDRFVLRDTTASRTIGGGRFIDLRAPARRRRTPQRLAELAALDNPDAAAALKGVLEQSRGTVDIGTFFQDRAMTEVDAAGTIAALDLVLLSGGSEKIAMLPARWAQFRSDLQLRLGDFHTKTPNLPGAASQTLRRGLEPRLSMPVFSAALDRLQREGLIAIDRSAVRLAAHKPKASSADDLLLQGIVPLLGGVERFRPPRVRDIATLRRLDENAVRRVLKAAAKRGDVAEIAPDHFFGRDTVIEMAGIARDVAAHSSDGKFTAAAFRDRLDNGRKVAILILEYFDKMGLTMRRGDLRLINPHSASLFQPPNPQR